jgi:hypothetical protein
MASTKRKSAAKKPAAKKPAVKSTAAKKTGTKTSGATKAVTKKPAPRKPVAKPAPAKKRGRPAAAPVPALLASKCTAVAFVREIEPVLPFWAKVGFFPAVTVPHGDKSGFVILSNGSVELMYQTWGLLNEDMPALGARSAQPDKVFLFVEVPDIEAVAGALNGEPVFLPRRDTFYNSTEIGYNDPQGHFVTFAQFKR